MTDDYPRARLDLAQYAARSQTQPCFICQIVEGTRDGATHVVYRDEFAIGFLNQYPSMLGYVLVAPIEHRVSVVDDFDTDAYLRLQTVVHRVGRAVSQAVPCERLYVLSLGSNQGNAHVHWHLAPLPPGIPYDEQQFHSLMWEATGGYLDIPQSDQAALAARIAGFLGDEFSRSTTS